MNRYSIHSPEFLVLWIMQDSGFKDSGLPIGDHIIGVEIHGAGPSQPIEFKYNRSKIGAVLNRLGFLIINVIQQRLQPLAGACRQTLNYGFAQPLVKLMNGRADQPAKTFRGRRLDAQGTKPFNSGILDPFRSSSFDKAVLTKPVGQLLTVSDSHLSEAKQLADL